MRANDKFRSPKAQAVGTKESEERLCLCRRVDEEEKTVVTEKAGGVFAENGERSGASEGGIT